MQKVAKRLAPKFVFGYHSVRDIQQEAIVLAIEAMERYDGIRPLENFLSVCVHNGLINYKRDNYERLVTPCLKCDYFSKECQLYEDIHECDAYRAWLLRNTAKKNLMSPICFHTVNDEHESNMSFEQDALNHMDQREVMELIDKHLSPKLRRLYIKFLNNVRISKQDQFKLTEAIKTILADYYDEAR